MGERSSYKPKAVRNATCGGLHYAVVVETRREEDTPQVAELPLFISYNIEIVHVLIGIQNYKILEKTETLTNITKGTLYYSNSSIYVWG